MFYDPAFVYALRNRLGRVVYVGATVDPKTRAFQHLRYGKHTHCRFEILQKTNTLRAPSVEQSYMDKFRRLGHKLTNKYRASFSIGMMRSALCLETGEKYSTLASVLRRYKITPTEEIRDAFWRIGKVRLTLPNGSEITVKRL